MKQLIIKAIIKLANQVPFIIRAYGDKFFPYDQTTWKEPQHSKDKM